MIMFNNVQLENRQPAILACQPGLFTPETSSLMSTSHYFKIRIP